MPIYEFRCFDCGENFEDFRNISQKEETGKCLSCQSKNIERVTVLTEDGCDCGCGCSTGGVSGEQCG